MRQNLDPLAFLIKSFQTEGDLDNVDTVIHQVHDNLKRLDQEISVQVQNSKSLGSHIDETKALVHSVVGKVSELQQQATGAIEESKMATGRAQYNVVSGMEKALDSLVFLRELRASMDLCVRHQLTGQYGRIQPLLEKQAALVPRFAKYMGVPVVDRLLSEVEDFQEQLLNDILNEFKVSYGKVESDADMMVHLAESARLMDAMGDHAATDLVKWFVGKKRDQLEYFVAHQRGQDWQRMEPVELEAARQESVPTSLADLQERFQWLEEQVDEYTENYLDVFPPHWEVSESFTHACCIELRGAIEPIVSKTGPTDAELQGFRLRTQELEEFFADRYAASALAADQSTTGLFAQRTASLNRTRSHSAARRGSMRRTGSAVGRPGFHIQWHGILSREVERFMTLDHEEVEVDDGGAEGTPGFGRPRKQAEASGSAGGSMLVPRMPRQIVGDDQVSRAVAELWDIKGDMLKEAALECILLSMGTSALAAQTDDEGEALGSCVDEVLRVQLGFSRRGFSKLVKQLRLPDQLKDIDLAAVHLAELQGVNLEPYLHYRFLLLETHRGSDFERVQDYETWFDRQATVFLSGLFWTLENLADADQNFAMVTLGNLESFSVRDAYYEIAGSIATLKSILSVDDVDSEAYIDVTQHLEEDIEKLYSHIDLATGNGAMEAANHMLPLPYPLNLELYTTIVLTLFDQDAWGELVPYADDILAVLAFWRQFCDVDDVMHAIAMVRCHFIAYKESSALARRKGSLADGGTSDALYTFEKAVAEMHRASAAAKTPLSDAANRFELAVTTDMLKSIELRLLDYHWCFVEDEMASVVRGEFDVFAAIKFAHLSADAGQLDKQRATEAVRFIKSSVAKFYSRLSKEVDKVSTPASATLTEADREDETPLSGFMDLGLFLVDEGIVKVFETAKQFKVYYSKATDAAVVQLAKGFKEEVLHRLEPYNEVTLEVSNLLSVVQDVVETLVELQGEKAADKHQLTEPFQRLIRRELEQQAFKFTDAVENCIKSERWEPVDKEYWLSSSAIDIFTMLSQALPMIIGSGLLLVEDNMTTLVQNVDGMVMKYAMHILRSCGEKPPLHSKKDKKKKEKKQKRQDDIEKIKDLPFMKRRNANKEASAAPSAVTDRPELSPEVAEVRPPYETQTLVELCVRYNAIGYCMGNIEKMSAELAAEQGLDDDVERDSLPLAGSAAVLESCAGQVCTYIGAKIVYYDLADVLIDQVYKPRPADTRIDAALEQLDDILAELFQMLPEEQAFKEVLHGLFCAFVNVYKCVRACFPMPCFWHLLAAAAF